MKTESIFEQDQVRLLTPLYLKPEARSRITIAIPDEDIASNRDWYPDHVAALPQVSNG